jgi:hypothetical protein
MTRVFFVVLFVAALTAGLSSNLFAQVDRYSVSPTPRITQSIDEGNMVKLARNTRPEAKNAANDRGPVPDGTFFDHIFIQLQRSPEQEQLLDKLIDELNDRNSPNFHKWLTPEEFGRFGVAQEDIDKITGWLQYHGLTINQVYPNGVMIDVSGSAGSVREAFHTPLHQIEVNGETHVANLSDPQVPAALAHVVMGPLALNDFKPHPMYRLASDYTFAGCASSTALKTEPGTCYAVTPQDNAVIYNLNPLWTAGYSGQGQTIAVVEDADSYTPSGKTNSADWTTYRTAFGLTSYSGTFSLVHPGSCTDPGVNGASLEAELDAEVATGIAPSAAIEMISCADNSALTFGGIIAMQNLINGASPYPGVMSVSYGVCEADTGAAGNLGFYNTYQQAAAQGISVFVSSGDEGSSGCGDDFSTTGYTIAGLSITGWGETPYNVSVGGTDFEDVYNQKMNANGGAALSTYWNTTLPTASPYGSAKSYIPEMPWDDSCANALISEVTTGSYTGYGASPGTCNNSTFDTSTTYLSTGAAAGGPSNCATGFGGTAQGSYLVSAPECQGWPKPSWQSGSSLSGGQAVYGQPTDGVRDIPDVSMFAANGDWGHYEIICMSDTATSIGGASCAGAPSTWTGLGGTSVATPTMAAIQALVNQKTGEYWGNPNPFYYQLGQNEYGTAGGTFVGSACNSSTGSNSGCVWNDVTQGDIALACEDNSGAPNDAGCYIPASTHGVTNTDTITAAAVINGGSGYTTAPTCTIAGPSNNNPYKSPAGTTLYAGGSQATCTATTSSSSTTAAWTITFSSTYAADYFITGDVGITVGGTTYTFVTGTPAVNQIQYSTSISSTNLAKNLEAAINGVSSQCGTTSCINASQTANSLATATVSSSTVTTTAKTTGYAGNFNVTTTGKYFDENALLFISVANTTPGQGPNYVSGITITAAGSGYGPETPITFGGPGSGAVAVANTSYSTANNTTYQPAWGAAPGWDMATGLGTPNANNLVNSSIWLASTATSVSSNNNPSTSGQSVTFTADITGTYSSYSDSYPTGTVTWSSNTGCGSTAVTQGNPSTASCTTTALPVGTDTITATYNGDKANGTSTGTLSGGQVVNASTLSQTITVTTAPPSSAAYNSTFPVAATASSGLAVAITTSGSCSGSGSGSATILMTSSTGTCSVIFNQAGGTVGSNTYSAAPTVTDTTSATTATATIAFSNLTQTYTGSALSPTVTTTPSGLSYSSTGYPDTSAGTYPVTATITNANYTATPASGSFVISAATATVTLSNMTQTYTGSALSPTCATTPSGLTTTLTGAPDTNAGSYPVTCTINAGQNYTGSASGTFVINKATATVTLSNMTQTYTGSALSPTVTTVPSGLTITPTGYPDTNAGSYSVTATVNDPNYTGSNSGTFVISAATATVTLSNMTQTYTGSALSPTCATTPSGLTTTLTGAPDTSAGSYPVTCTINAGQNYTGSASGTFVINKATATVALSNMTQTYTGSALSPTVTTVPSGLSITPTGYPDTNAGSYSVTATVNDPNYTGSASGTFVIGQATNTVTFTTPAPASAEYGSIFTVAASGLGTGTISYGSDGVVCTNVGPNYTVIAGSGTCTVTATQAADTNYGTASASESVSATPANASVGVGSSSNPSDYGASVTFTATISSDTGMVKGRNGATRKTAKRPMVVGGSVTWSDSNGPLTCTETSSSTTTVAAGYPGTATCTTSTLAVNPSDTITGSYSGDANHTTGTGTTTQTINAASTTTSVSSTPNPSTYATQVVFTATINGANGLVKGRKPGKNGMKPMDPTGTVSWSANTGCAPSTVSGNPGVATCTTSSATHLPVGTDPVTATYSGDGNHSGSSGSVNQVVQGGIATTIDVTGVSPSNEDFGANTAVTITALLSWTGHGTAPTTADVTIGGNGNGTYGATSCLPRSGETITCTATYTPSNADVAGVYTETASFSGDTNYAASSSSETNNFTINQASASVSIGTSLNPSTYGQAVTFTATITGENNEVKGRKPARKNGIKPMDVTGSVTWSVGGNPIPDCGTDGTTPVTSGNPGVATCTTSSLGGGTDTITATYSGDSNHGGAVGTLSGQVVNPASQAIALSSVPANAVYNTSFTVVASASSGLPVAFSSGGACSNSGATYTMTSGTGKCTVIVDQAGNANYAAAPEVTASLFAVKASQIITVTEPAPASAPKGTVFTVAAVSNEGLPITYANQNDGECTNSGPTFTLVAKGGTCFVSFNAAANNNYASASVTEQTVIQAAVKPTVSFTGAPASAFYQSTFTVSATSNSTSTPTITAAGACTVSGTTVTMKLGTGTCTLTAKWAANPQYLAASATQTTTAEKLTSVVTWATPAPITYGTKLSPTQLNATANVAGNFAYTPKSGTKPAVPTPPATCDTLSVTFTPALVSDYTKETATVCLVVNPAP